MNVLVACEFSGVVRDAFIRRGHNAISCDLLPSESQGPHIQGDVTNLLKMQWDLMIAHPPCTYLCNSGVRWLFNEDGSNDADRWYNMRESVRLFRWLLDADIPRIAIENPVMHGHASRLIKSPHAQSIQPWQFGHGETKRTCLWLKNLPPLEPTNVVEGRDARIHMMSPGPDRGKKRSVTYQGIADAMADQWGSLPIEERPSDGDAS